MPQWSAASSSLLGEDLRPTSERIKLFRTIDLAVVVALLTATAILGPPPTAASSTPPVHRVPIIDVTDLYQPFQDPGDNFDLVTAYALPEVDLKAVILDTHNTFRSPISNHPILHDSDHNGPRDAGFTSVLQLNYIFNRNIPVGAGPFNLMRSPEDKMLDAPGFQQQGVELILKVLRESPEPVAIMSFGSARPIAVAYNRDPELFRSKLARIYFSGGSSSAGYLEWNVALDPNATLRLLRSDLPIDIFPCATKNGPFSYEAHNSYWQLPDLQFVKRLDPKIRRYLEYALGRKCRCDFLRAMDDDFPPSEIIDAYSHPHHVWETALWMAVSGRVLVRLPSGNHRIIPAAQVAPQDKVLPNLLEPCILHVSSDATFTIELTKAPSNFRIYDRQDPFENQSALREAFPELYLSFHP
jgi:pyrimidine-specific ribonucleoside hydrolase